MFDIKGKVAIVTGSANGLGLATAEALLHKGANVVLSDINRELLVKEATRLTNLYPMQVTFKVTDVSDEEQVKDLIGHALDKFGKLDIMVANAGIGGGGQTHVQSTKEFQRYIDINLMGVYYSNKFAVEQMVKQGGGGTIVNLSSILGVVGAGGASAYNTTKFAVRGFTKSLALEYAPLNIRVNSVHPGYFITGMVNSDIMGDEGIKQLLSMHPLSAGINRLGEPEEIAHAVVFCIENTFLTGAEIIVDGGYTAQ